MSERPKVGTYVGVYGQREPRDYEVQIEWLEARLAAAEKMLAHEATFWRERVTALDKKLAEAEALLREARAWTSKWPSGLQMRDEVEPLNRRLDAFLSPDSASLNMEPAPDGSRVLCVADQPEAAGK